jgi:hypothetical protein
MNGWASAGCPGFGFRGQSNKPPWGGDGGSRQKEMLKEVLKEMLAWLILNRTWKSGMEIPGK